MPRPVPLAALVLLALLLAPAVAYVLGARQGLLGNRLPAPLPPLDRQSVRERETFAGLDALVRDRTPLRASALRLRGALVVGGLRESPSSQVRLGAGGWRYYADDLKTCGPREDRPTYDPAETFDVLARTLRADGRRAVVTVAPSKDLVRPGGAPGRDGPARRCAMALERRVQDALRRIPGGVPLAPPLRAAQARGETFLRGDTHWSWRGRLAAGRTLLNALRPGLADEVGLAPGAPIRRSADLDELMGLIGRTDPDRVVAAARTARPLPRPLAVGDSQLGFLLTDPMTAGRPPLLARALPGGRLCSWLDVGGGLCDRELADARTMLVETVAREMRLIEAVCWRPIALAAPGLAGAPGRWAGARGTPVVPAAGALRLRPLPDPERTADASAPRGTERGPMLIRVPLRGPRGRLDATTTTLAVAGPAGRPLPCAAPGPVTAGAALTVPVPAGVRPDDVALTLRAPPGTRVGAPEVVPLDGRDRRRASAR